MTVWTALTTPWDGEGAGSLLFRGCFAPGLGAGAGRLCFAGRDAASVSSMLTSDDGGTTFADPGSVFPNGGITSQGFPRGITFAAALGLVVAVGQDAAGTAPLAALSSDGGLTWGAVFNPFGSDVMQGVASNPAGDLLLAIDAAGKVWSTTDGTAWTLEATPLASGQNIRFAVGLNKWLACASFGAPVVLASAPAATPAVWTTHSTPLDGGIAWDAAYQRAASKLYACGADSGGNATMAASPDGGTTWATEATPLDGVGEMLCMAEAGATMLAVGDDGSFPPTIAVAETDGSGVWTGDATPIEGGCQGVFYSPQLAAAFVLGLAAASDFFVVATAPFTPIGPPTPPTPTYTRIYGIEIALSDDGVEQVSQLVTSPDGFAA